MGIAGTVLVLTFIACFASLLHFAVGQLTCVTGELCPVSNNVTTCSGVCTEDNCTDSSCNTTYSTHCRDGFCYCAEDEYLDFKEKKCLPRNDFMLEKNITSYKVMPGDYCATTDDCVEGLGCNRTICACPKQCRYVENMLACDCGGGGGEVGVVLFAIIVGFLNVFCWFKCFQTSVCDHYNGKVYHRGNLSQRTTVTPQTQDNTGLIAPTPAYNIPGVNYPTYPPSAPPPGSTYHNNYSSVLPPAYPLKTGYTAAPIGATFTVQPHP